MTMNNAHEFAIFYKENFSAGPKLEIGDLDIIFRVRKVLRLKIGEQLVLFNDFAFAVVKILGLSDSKLVVEKILFQKNLSTGLKVHLFIGLLKKQAFEEMVYLATEAGVDSITPLLTKKVHHNFWNQKEFDRLNKIICNAREQAKKFSPVVLNQPVLLDKALEGVATQQDAKNIFFDSSGSCALQEIGQMLREGEESFSSRLNLFIGPEAGFASKEEDSILGLPKIKKLALTKTILRSPEAAFLACSLFTLKV